MCVLNKELFSISLLIFFSGGFFIFYIMIHRLKSSPFLGLILGFLGVIFFSAKAVFVKMAYQYDVDAISLLLLRLLFSLPVYIAVLLNLFVRKRIEIGRIDLLKLFILGLLGYYLASFLDFAGLNYISASLERLILFVYPTVVLILSSVFYKNKPTSKQMMAVVITYLGVLLAFYKNTLESNDNLWKGAVLIFFSAVSYATYLVGSGDIIPRLGTKLFTSAVMIVATLASFIHFYISEDVNLFGFEPQVYWITLGMAMISTIIPSFLIAEALKRLGANTVAILGSIGPVSTIILAAIFLKERITIYQAIGTVIVIGGILVLAKQKKDAGKRK